MPRHAAKRSSRTRRFSAGGAVTVGTVAMACTALFGTAASAHAATPVTTATVAGTAATTYTVKPGDHLASIARALKVPGGWQAIASANSLTSPYVLEPGQVLTLPAGSAASAAPAPAAPAAAPAKAAGTATAATPAKAAVATGTQGYADNLDGWIKESLAVLKQHGIPGSYDGIYRNVIRESSGNPQAINLWDSNAAAGIPSKGLLQVIQPTFNAYHVPGTSWNIYDPIANITAACNYAYHRYGSIDNVNGAY
ncbi:LysM peptidoglycan-binding domain-containing protein [Streptomyces sp. NPDC052040]|uniref:LysM peptidoglycan-binding domain-containing protein n=1 Tax=unclassified Streptomyces TaxID=2593676 RepID=UPI0037D1740E